MMLCMKEMNVTFKILNAQTGMCFCMISLRYCQQGKNTMHNNEE